MLGMFCSDTFRHCVRPGAKVHRSIFYISLRTRKSKYSCLLSSVWEIVRVTYTDFTAVVSVPDR